MAGETPSSPGAGAAVPDDDEDAAAAAFRPLDFEPGAEVEVRRNEDGLRGTWYEAEVLRCLPARQRYDVVYATHVSEKRPVVRLRERVNCNYVRPRPPPVVDRQYRLHDRVEAFFKDGWWFGIISGVVPLHDVGRFNVCFPTRREEMEFGASDLRPQLHWHSDQRRWITVEEMESDLPLFKVGDQVEASRELKEYGPTWYSAIVVKVFDVNTFFVEYEKTTKKDGKGELLTEILDVQHMRPALPAEPRVMDFAVGVKVEVLVHGGWSPGVVMAAFGTGKHVVRLPNCSRCSLYHYDSSLMRHQRIWNGSRWVHSCKPNPQKLQDVDGIKSPTSTGKQKTGASCNAPALSSASGDEVFLHHNKENPERLKDVNGVQSMTMKQKDDASCIAPASCSVSGDMPQDKGVHGTIRSAKYLTTAGDADPSSCIAPVSCSVSGEMPQDKCVDGTGQSVKHLITAGHANPSSCNAPASCSISGDMLQDECVDGINQSVKYLTTASDANPSTNGNQVDHMEADCPTPDGESPVSMRSCDLTENVEKQISVNEDSVSARSPPKVVTEVSERPSVHLSPNASPLKKVSLPFVKGSPLWESIESTEVFCKMPQDPHFRPLERYSMNLREGMAIGLMISFASLTSSIQKLSIGDAQTEIEARLRALEELEANGFNVSSLRMCLNELLQIQFNYKQNEARKAMLEAKMLKMRMVSNEYDELIASLDKAIGGLEQSIADFRKKRDSIMKQKIICDSEIIKLQLEAQELEEDYCSAKEKFDARVAAPL